MKMALEHLLDDHNTFSSKNEEVQTYIHTDIL